MKTKPNYPALLWTMLAMAVCTLLYKYTLRAWFQEDDFAWLALRLQVHGGSDLLHALFSPMAQGSIRPLSERALFMGFSAIFGLNALPYRILVYITQLGNIAMLGAIASRLFQSPPARSTAPVLWVCNIALAIPMTWTSAYNEILCSFFLLSSFYFLLRYIHSPESRLLVAQWIAFIAALASLEVASMYPFVAILYTSLFARHLMRKVLPLLIPSAALFAVHAAINVSIKDPHYLVHPDLSMVGTLLEYCALVLGPASAALVFPGVTFYPAALTAALGVSVIVFVAIRFRAGDRLPLFFCGWFLIYLAPFLPLRDHVSEYYLTIPALGLALLGSSAISLYARYGTLYRSILCLSLVGYLACSVPTTRKMSADLWARSARVKKLVLGVKSAHSTSPAKTILLEGVDGTLFWSAVYGHPFQLFGADRVFITLDTAKRLTPYPELANVFDYTLPEAEIEDEFRQNNIVVLAASQDQIRDVTNQYRSLAFTGDAPKRVDVGRPLFESLLGSSWYPSEGDYRWMPGHATVRLGAPANGRGELRIDAFCGPVQVEPRPLVIVVSIQGKRQDPVTITDCAKPILLRRPFEVSPSLKQVDIEIAVNHTIRVGHDLRDLGLAVRSIEIVDLQPPH